MLATFQNKAMGISVETLVSKAQKKFSDRISHTRTLRSYETKCKYKGKKHM